MHSNHLVNIGFEDIGEVKPHASRSHNEHVITLLDQGELVFSSKSGNESLINITPGMVTLMPAGVPHRPISGSGVKIWWLNFCTSCLDLDESDALMSPFLKVRLGAQPLIRLPPERLEFFITLLNELNAAVSNAPFQVIKSLLILLLNEIKKVETTLDKHTHGQSKAVSAALHYIQQHSLQAISLKDVANAVHQSPSYLATNMKKSTGFSVGEWINNNRLHEACSRLQHSHDSIEKIAHSIGWSDVTHFIRQFKKANGVTPAVWRKRLNTGVKVLKNNDNSSTK